MGRVFTRAHPWGVFPPQFGAFAVFPRLLFLYLVLESSLAFVLSGLNFLVLRSRTYKIDSRMNRFAFGMKTENSSKKVLIMTWGFYWIHYILQPLLVWRPNSCLLLLHCFIDQNSSAKTFCLFVRLFSRLKESKCDSFEICEANARISTFISFSVFLNAVFGCCSEIGCIVFSFSWQLWFFLRWHKSNGN